MDCNFLKLAGEFILFASSLHMLWCCFCPTEQIKVFYWIVKCSATVAICRLIMGVNIFVLNSFLSVWYFSLCSEAGSSGQQLGSPLSFWSRIWLIWSLCILDFTPSMRLIVLSYCRLYSWFHYKSEVTIFIIVLYSWNGILSGIVSSTDKLFKYSIPICYVMNNFEEIAVPKSRINLLLIHVFLFHVLYKMIYKLSRDL